MRPVRSEDSYRNVYQKNGTPGEELDKNTAEGVASNRASVDGDLVYSDALSESFASEGICNNRDTIDEEKRSTYTLNKAEHQELLSSLGEAGEQRTYGEQGEVHIVQPDPAVQVRNSSNSIQKYSDHEPVDGDEPDTNNQIRVQSENYLRKAHNKNTRIQCGHENADCSDGENDPLVLQKTNRQNSRRLRASAHRGIKRPREMRPRCSELGRYTETRPRTSPDQKSAEAI